MSPTIYDVAELAQRVGLSLTALSLFKTGKLKGLRFGSLNAICRELDCQPGDIVQYIPDTNIVDSNTE